MATTWTVFVFLLLPSSLLMSTPMQLAVAAVSNSSSTNKQIAVVHVINGLPAAAASSQQLYISCGPSGRNMGTHILRVGEDYKWGVQERALYYCESLWDRYISSWHGFQPKRDEKQATVFWLAKENGIFLSWDNSTWVKKAAWQTE